MMRLVTDDFVPETVPATDAAAAAVTGAADAWPAEVDMILSAMDAAKRPDTQDRRAAVRLPHRVRADLRLFAHDPLNPPIALYTRDVSATGVGFITKDRLPLGYNGLVRITSASGNVVTATCSVYRCRESINGWYEGALHFAQRQPDLGA